LVCDSEATSPIPERSASTVRCSLCIEKTDYYSSSQSLRIFIFDIISRYISKVKLFKEKISHMNAAELRERGRAPFFVSDNPLLLQIFRNKQIEHPSVAFDSVALAVGLEIYVIDGIGKIAE